MPKKIKTEDKEKPPIFKVGDFVSFGFGNGIATGKIVEDRGCLGVGGRRLHGIKFEINPGYELVYTEMPEEELTAATAEERAKYPASVTG